MLIYETDKQSAMWTADSWTVHHTTKHIKSWHLQYTAPVQCAICRRQCAVWSVQFTPPGGTPRPLSPPQVFPSPLRTRTPTLQATDHTKDPVDYLHVYVCVYLCMYVYLYERTQHLQTKEAVVSNPKSKRQKWPPYKHASMHMHVYICRCVKHVHIRIPVHVTVRIPVHMPVHVPVRVYATPVNQTNDSQILKAKGKMAAMGTYKNAYINVHIYMYVRGWRPLGTQGIQPATCT